MMKGLSIAMLLVVLFYADSLEIINICKNSQRDDVKKRENENPLKVQRIVTPGNRDNARNGCNASINGFTSGDWIALLEGFEDCAAIGAYALEVNGNKSCISADDNAVKVVTVSDTLHIKVPARNRPPNISFTIFHVYRPGGHLQFSMTGDGRLVGGVAESGGTTIVRHITFVGVAGLTVSFHVVEIDEGASGEPSINISGTPVTNLPTSGRLYPVAVKLTAQTSGRLYPEAVKLTTQLTNYVTISLYNIKKFLIKYSVIRCSAQLENAELASIGTAAKFNPGNTTTYRCKEGWNHGSASHQTTCELNKDNVTASFKDISCDEVTCPRLVNGNNTIYHFKPDVYRYKNNDIDNTTTTVVLFNTTADLHCTDDSEYTVNGSLTSVCDGSGEWDPHLSTCIPRPRSTTVLVVMIGLALAAAVVVGGILVWMYVTKRSNEVANQSDSREDINGRSRSSDEIIPYQSSQGLAKAYPSSPGPQDSKQRSPRKRNRKGAESIEQYAELSRPITHRGAPQSKKEVVHTQITPKNLRKPKVPPKMF